LKTCLLWMVPLSWSNVSMNLAIVGSGSWLFSRILVLAFYSSVLVLDVLDNCCSLVNNVSSLWQSWVFVHSFQSLSGSTGTLAATGMSSGTGGSSELSMTILSSESGSVGSCSSSLQSSMIMTSQLSLIGLLAQVEHPWKVNLWAENAIVRNCNTQTVC
jgi:hypothetical protein